MKSIKIVASIFILLLAFLVTWDAILWTWFPTRDASEFGNFLDEPVYTPMFKYFIWAAVLLYASLISVFKWKLKLLSGQLLMLVVWLVVSALYQYYAIFDLKVVEVVGVVVALISIGLYIAILAQPKFDSKLRSALH